VRRLAAGLVLLLVAGCGVPQDEAPRALDRAEAPFRVFESEAAPTPTGDLAAELWLVRGDRPEAVLRQVPRPGSPQQVLGQLFSGPTEQESAAGLTTAIPTAFELEDVTVDDGIAVVTLAGLGDQVRTDNNVAYAQIVATLDARPEIDGVRFRTDDGDLPVPRGDGSLTDAPVNRRSYGELLGQPVATTPVPPAPVPSAPAPSA
jgi:hypothetical protein